MGQFRSWQGGQRCRLLTWESEKAGWIQESVCFKGRSIPTGCTPLPKGSSTSKHCHHLEMSAVDRRLQESLRMKPLTAAFGHNWLHGQEFVD